MVTDSLDVVIGVDTHRDAHALALVRCRDGVLVAEEELAANRAGYRAALRLGKRSGARRLWALEGTGSYGAGLARFLAERGERVCEVERPAREGSRRRLKSDSLDALRAARAALAGQALASPRAAGRREALRVLLQTREGAVAIRRSGLNQLRALVVSAPEELREGLRGRGRDALVRACTRLRPHPRQQAERYATALALRSVARRVEQATQEAAELESELRRLVSELCPQLLSLEGVGPISAAQVLVSWSHRGRFRSEAAFARLAGAPPLAVSFYRMAIASLILLPILTQTVMDASPAASGTVLLMLSGLGAVVSPVGGRLSDRYGRRLPAVIGSACMAAGLAVLWLVTGRVALVGLTAALALVGIGSGFSGPSRQAAALESVPEHAIGMAAGTYFTSRYVGGVLGASLAGVVLAGGTTATTIAQGFGTLAVVGLAVTAVSFGLRGRSGQAPAPA